MVNKVPPGLPHTLRPGGGRPQGVARGGALVEPYLPSQFFRKMNTFQTMVPTLPKGRVGDDHPNGVEMGGGVGRALFLSCRIIDVS